ncbi:TPA: hypothetical protein L7W01_005366 [Klebsiella variicola subsp. variicola]|nr:hypothetical protein [Klebsiella variicola subsp. variicola]HBZ7348460.1 hypothetical protein [Klebsiella variicola subsp. variicola]
MKTVSFSVLTIFLISLNVNAIPIHVRKPPNTGAKPTNPFYFGDSCNRNGREVYLINTATKAPVSYVICKQTVGRKSEVTPYTIPGKLDAYSDAVKQHLGCTVSNDGISTGYSVLWFSFGTYVPSDIRDASQALVNEATGPDSNGKDTTILENYNTKRDILIDYIRGDGKLISNITIPHQSVDTIPTPFPRNRIITRAIYSFPYSGGEVPCNY